MDTKAPERLLRIVLLLLSQPYRYTRKDLAARFGVSLSSIKSDIEILKNVGIGYQQEGHPHYRCAIIPEDGFKELKYLLPLTNDEKAFLESIILQSSGSSKQTRVLINKLNSLYDFQKLGLAALRRPQLDIIDKIEIGIKEHRAILLESYRSNNSNQIRDRRVEPFDLNTELGTLQAFDLDIQKCRHFAIHRITRVQLLDAPWAFANHHRRDPTDVFKIVSSEQVRTHFQMDVYAYNLLIEQFPQAKQHILPGSLPNTYDFDGKVNARFYGLLNFVLANATHLQLYEPYALKEAVRAAAAEILAKFND